MAENAFNTYGHTMQTRILLCRHGVTELTEIGAWDGRGGINPDLSPTGRDQASYLAERVAALLSGEETPRVISSSLNRAIQTAAPIAEALGAQAQIDPAWDEYAFGEWDGRRGVDLAAEFPEEFARFWADQTFPLPGGESHADLLARVGPALQALMAEGGTIVVVAHWGSITCALSHALGIDLKVVHRMALAPASMSALRVRDLDLQVDFVNDLGALPPRGTSSR